MKNNLFIVLFLCLSSLSYAQIPKFDWARNYSGYSSSSDYALVSCVTTDISGNIYSAGFFRGTIDFDPGPGISNLTATSLIQGFVTKTTPSGNLVWVKHFAGDDELVIYSIAADNKDGVFLTGGFRGTIDCNPGSGSALLYSTSINAFIIKLDTTGIFKWAKSIRNSAGDVTLYKLIIDENENLLFAGSYIGGTPDMDPGVPVVTLGASCSGTECFTLKLDHDGNYIWAKSAGQRCSNILSSELAVDSKNNVYLTGTYFGTKDFDPGAGVFTLSTDGSYDIFIAKLDSNGNFIKAISMGSTRTDEAKGISMDLADNVYITGSYTDKTDFDPGADTFYLSPTGFSSNNIFVARYDSGLSFKWAKNFPNPPSIGSGHGYGFKLACDKDCNVNTMGAFNGQLDFNPGVDTFILRTSNESIFVSRLDSSGNFVWAGQFNGINNFFMGGIHADAFDNLYTFGNFSGRTDFDPSADSANITPIIDDGFLHKLSICYPFDTTNITACRNFTLEGKTYTSTGTYTQFLTTERNCDVTLTFNLTIDEVNDTILKSGTTLSAKGIGTSYQWVTCPSFSAVSGATSSIFAPSTDGDYALIIKNGTCVDTSICMNISGTGIGEINGVDRDILLLPNPAINQTTLSFRKVVHQISIEVISLTGHVVFSNENFDGQSLNIDLQNLSSGMYLVKIRQEGNGIIIKKLIKK